MYHQCKFCGAKISNKQNLARHQRTNKTCLNKRGKTPIKFVCVICDKPLTSKANLEIHEIRCQNKFETNKKIDLILEKFEALAENLELMTKKPSTVNNYNNLVVLDPEKLKEFSKLLTCKHIGFPESVFVGKMIDFIKETKMLENKVIVADSSRLIFKIKLEFEEITDRGGGKIGSVFFSGIYDKACKFIDDKIEILEQRIIDEPVFIAEYESIKLQMKNIIEEKEVPNKLKDIFVKRLATVNFKNPQVIEICS